MLKICVLNVSFEGSKTSRSALDPPMNPEPFLPQHHYTKVEIKKETALEQITKLSQQNFVCFINLVVWVDYGDNMVIAICVGR